MKHTIETIHYKIKPWLKPQRLLIIAMLIALLTWHGKIFIALLLIYFCFFAYDLFTNYHNYDMAYETAKEMATDIVIGKQEEEDQNEK